MRGGITFCLSVIPFSFKPCLRWRLILSVNYHHDYRNLQALYPFCGQLRPVCKYHLTRTAFFIIVEPTITTIRNISTTYAAAHTLHEIFYARIFYATDFFFDCFIGRCIGCRDNFF